jgi:hypothetical protein
MEHAVYGNMRNIGLQHFNMRTNIYCKEIWSVGVDWFKLDQKRVQQVYLVVTVINILVPYKVK